jgi:hypothetical protein
VPDPDAPGWDACRAPPNRSRGRRLENKNSFRLHAPLSECSGSRPCRLLRRRGQWQGEAGRATSPVGWVARHCQRPLSRDHTGDGHRAVPRPGARPRALALRCDSSIEATLFAAKGFPRSLRCPSAASAFEMSRKLNPRCPLGWARSCARLTTSGRASAWLLRPSTLTPVARLRLRAAANLATNVVFRTRQSPPKPGAQA